MAADNPAEDLALKTLPTELHPLIPPALRRAYGAVDHLIDTALFLQTPSGGYQRGDLIALSVECEMERLIKAGSLPFDYAWEFYPNETGKHLVMLTEDARITISQIEDPTKKPRRASFRAQFSLPNTKFLFPEEEQRFMKDAGRHLLHIVHGYQSLTFAFLTVPHAEAKGNAWRSPNLMNIPHVVPEADLSPAEGPTGTPDPQATENLARLIFDRNKDRGR